MAFTLHAAPVALPFSLRAERVPMADRVKAGAKSVCQQGLDVVCVALIRRDSSRSEDGFSNDGRPTLSAYARHHLESVTNTPQRAPNFTHRIGTGAMLHPQLSSIVSLMVETTPAI